MCLCLKPQTNVVLQVKRAKIWGEISPWQLTLSYSTHKSGGLWFNKESQT